MATVRHFGAGALLLLMAGSAFSCEKLAPCPAFDVSPDAPLLLMLRPYSPGPAERADALADIFTIRGQTVTLHPPIDWDQDPINNRSWRMNLHALGPSTQVSIKQPLETVPDGQLSKGRVIIGIGHPLSPQKLVVRMDLPLTCLRPSIATQPLGEGGGTPTDPTPEVNNVASTGELMCRVVVQIQTFFFRQHGLDVSTASGVGRRTPVLT